MPRILLARDSDGRWYVRRTLHVTHDNIAGEVRYAAKPLADFDSLEEALHYIQSEIGE